MESLFTFTSPPSQCGYLPDQRWELQYEIVGRLTPDEYQARLKRGWRRFGHSLFRPVCKHCRKCQSLRVPVAAFRQDRSQKRTAKMNEGRIVLTIGPPSVNEVKLELYDRYHRFQHEQKGWPEHDVENVADYIESFVDNPFSTQEWNYSLDGRLVGVGFVDHLTEGLSAIYFYYDPEERDRSLGVWNVLSVIHEAARQGLPHVYLGFYVEGCQSLEYKARYRPNETLAADGVWKPFRT